MFQPRVSAEVKKKTKTKNKQKKLAAFSEAEIPHISFANQPDEDEDGDDDEEEEEEEEGLLVSSPPCSGNLIDVNDDVTSLSFSFLLPVQTDLWAGLNCHVTFFVVDDCSDCVNCFVIMVVVVVVAAGLVDATGADCVASMLVVTPLTLLAPSPSLLFLSGSLKGSLSTSGSPPSSYMSQPRSAGGRLDRATPPADLLAAADILEERLGSESDRSESQSLSPATEPQPSTDTSTGPDPELSESDSLEHGHRKTKILDVSKVQHLGLRLAFTVIIEYDYIYILVAPALIIA